MLREIGTVEEVTLPDLPYDDITRTILEDNGLVGHVSAQALVTNSTDSSPNAAVSTTRYAHR